MSEAVQQQEEQQVAGTLAQVGEFQVFQVREEFTFQKVDADKRTETFEYEEVLDKDKKIIGYRRKPVVVTIPYPLLANIGVAGNFDPVKGVYENKREQFVFSCLQQAVYQHVRNLINSDVPFKESDLSLDALAAEIGVRKGGRRAEIDQDKLVALCEDFEKEYLSWGKGKDAAAKHTAAFKSRFRGAENWKEGIIAKMGENLAAWFAKLDDAGIEKHADAFKFLEGKITTLMEASSIEL